jgi:hypothetical protein
MPQWDSNPRSQCWSGRKQFVPDTDFCYRLSKPRGLVWLEGVGKLNDNIMLEICQEINIIKLEIREEIDIIKLEICEEINIITLEIRKKLILLCWRYAKKCILFFK